VEFFRALILRKVGYSDVARPLSYKTKITYFFQDQDRSGQDQDHFFKTKTKTVFLKTIKLLTQDYWRSQKFWLGGAKMENFCDVILVTFFGNVMVMMSL